MNLKDLIISLFLFSGVMIGSGVFYSGLKTEYASLMDHTLEKDFTMFNYTSDLYTRIGMSEEKIESIKSQGLGWDDVAGWFLLGGLESVRILLGLPVVFSQMIADVIFELGLQVWVFDMVFGIVLVLVIFGIIYAAIKVKI